MYRKAIVTKGSFKGETVLIEGTDKEVWGKSVWDMIGNPSALKYAVRSASSTDNIPMSGISYYGKHENGLGDVFHESELAFNFIRYWIHHESDAIFKTEGETDEAIHYEQSIEVEEISKEQYEKLKAEGYQE